MNALTGTGSLMVHRRARRRGAVQPGGSGHGAGRAANRSRRVASAVRAELEQILARLVAEDPTVSADCVEVVAREAWQQSDGGAAARLTTLLSDQLVEPRHHRGPDRCAPTGWSQALWEAAGIPAVVCGPAGGGLHADDEWLEVDQLSIYVEAVAATIAEFLAG